MKPNFEIELLPDAIEFLENPDDKTREKIYCNIKKAQFVNDNELFKKLSNFICEFQTYITVKHIDFFHFGTKRKNTKCW
jgi:hypothetical protein